VHDISDAEARGLPAVFVASSEFRDAASAQGRSLGFSPAAVFVPHPIQDRSDEEMRAYADAAYADVLRALTSA
jgi:alkanesulfonate monooxygenase SsuD/methylene tetrahydromethanopterin reductase-like flavin-dependent oxidoreductase (luciferase family)